MEDNCFTTLCWSLPHISINQPQVSLGPLPPASHPMPALYVVTEPWVALPGSHSASALALCLTRGDEYYFHAAVSIRPTLSSPHCVHKSVHHICASTAFLQKVSPAQFSSVAQSCLTLCDPMDCSTPGLPAHHQLPEFTQTHVHRVGDAIQPSHPLLSPSPPALNLSQHRGLFQ